MNPVWAEIAKYAFYAVAAHAICKYALADIFSTAFSQPRADAIKSLAEAYKVTYPKAVEERAKMAIELAKLKKSNDEISEILDKTIPLPDAPEAE